MKIDNFFSELKRRNVYKVAVAYAVIGWLLVQVATQVFPFFAHGRCRSCRARKQEISRLDLCRNRWHGVFDRIDFLRTLLGTKASTERGGGSFDDPTKIDRGVAVRKPKR